MFSSFYVSPSSHPSQLDCPFVLLGDQLLHLLCFVLLPFVVIGDISFFADLMLVFLTNCPLIYSSLHQPTETIQNTVLTNFITDPHSIIQANSKTYHFFSFKCWFCSVHLLLFEVVAFGTEISSSRCCYMFCLCCPCQKRLKLLSRRLTSGIVYFFCCRA